MATTASIAFSRKPAPLERVRLLFGGIRWWIGVIFLAPFVWPIFSMQHNALFVLFAATLIAPALAIFAAVLDRKVADRLAFVGTLPWSSSPRWLLLLPLQVATLLFIGAAAWASGRSPAVALTALGCCWWAVSIGRWLGRRWWTTLAAVPALALAPGAVLPIIRSGNWGVAAMVSVAFAALGLLLSPEMRAGASTDRSVAWSRPRPVGVAGTVLTSGARSTGFAAALRLWWLGAVHVMRWVLIGSVFGASVAFVWLPEMFGFHQGFLILALGAAIAVGQSSKAGRHDFLCALPLNRARLFCGTVLPWIIPLLVVPIVLFARLQLESPDGDGPLARTLRDADGFDVRALRGYLGAILPQTWPRGSFPADRWAPVVAMLGRHGARAAMFALAVAASFSAAWLLSERKVVVKVAVIPRWAVYLLPGFVYYGSTLPSLIWHRPQSLALMALLVADTALIWFLVWRLPPTPAAAPRGPR